jgi:hypothetical protein
VIVAGALFELFAMGLAAWFGPFTPLGAAIFQVAPPFLNTLQAGVQRRLSPELWDSVFLPVLEAPVWVIPFAIGAVLVLIGVLRRRRG